MRIFIVTMILILTTGIGFAADKQLKKEPKNTNVQKSADQKTKKEQKTPAWPRPYKSTEQISVDSSVPFPTDI
jgi:hypothetical protein